MNSAIYQDRTSEPAPPLYDEHMAWTAEHPNGIQLEPSFSTAAVEVDSDWSDSDSEPGHFFSQSDYDRERWANIQAEARQFSEAARRMPILVQHGSDQERANWTYIENLPKRIEKMVAENDIDGLIALGGNTIYASQEDVLEWDRYPDEVKPPVIGGVLHHVIGSLSLGWDDHLVRPIVQALIGAGFDVNQRSFTGDTVMHILGRYIEPGYDPTGRGQTKERLQRLVQTLIAAGVNIDITNNNGDTWWEVMLEYKAMQQTDYAEYFNIRGSDDGMVEIGKPYADLEEIRGAIPNAAMRG